MAHNLHRDYEQGARQAEPGAAPADRARPRASGDRLHARRRRASPRSTQALDAVFDEYDAILTPAAPGEAPRGLDSTGNPVFCTIWTYLGTPAVTLPLLQGENGLPIGVQLVGRRGNDARLLRTASWLVENACRRRAPVAVRAGRQERGARRARKRNAYMTNLMTGIIGIAGVMHLSRHPAVVDQGAAADHHRRACDGAAPDLDFVQVLRAQRRN